MFCLRLFHICLRCQRTKSLSMADHFILLFSCLFHWMTKEEDVQEEEGEGKGEGEEGESAKTRITSE